MRAAACEAPAISAVTAFARSSHPQDELLALAFNETVGTVLPIVQGTDENGLPGLERPIVRRSAGFDVNVSHQTAFSMVEDVAMKHPHAGTLVEGHQDADGFVDWDIDGVLPRHRAQRLLLLVERKEEESVKMEWMCELGVVL